MHKLSFLTKLRMWRDYLNFVVFLQRGETVRLFLGGFIFILSVYLVWYELTSKFFGSHEENALSLIVVLIIVKFIWEAYVASFEIRAYFHINRSILRNNLVRPFVKPSPSEQEAGYEQIEIPGNKADLIFASPKVNKLIQTTPLSITLSNSKRKHITKYIQTHRDILLQYLNHYFFNSLHTNTPFTNDLKLCLSKDINLNSKHVVCHTGGYYESFVTNQVSGTTLVIKDKVHTTITTEHIFPSHEDSEGNRYLADVATSQMNDHLGCSTIGFTSDHYFLFWVQGNATQFSSHMLTPTGSGSSNYKDLVNHNLQKTIIHTMERELMEETDAASDVAQAPNKTLILGFYRWVTRGGKPEFSGITKLAGNADQYKPNPIEARTEKSSVLKFKLESIENLPKVLDQIREKNNVSTPLYMCLYQLEEMYKENPKELAAFLFGSFGETAEILSIPGAKETIKKGKAQIDQGRFVKLSDLD